MAEVTVRLLRLGHKRRCRPQLGLPLGSPAVRGTGCHAVKTLSSITERPRNKGWRTRGTAARAGHLTRGASRLSQAPGDRRSSHYLRGNLVDEAEPEPSDSWYSETVWENTSWTCTVWEQFVIRQLMTNTPIPFYFKVKDTSLNYHLLSSFYF